MAEMAKDVLITEDEVLIDGKPFPWEIKNELTAAWGGGLNELTLTVFVSGELVMEGVDG